MGYIIERKDSVRLKEGKNWILVYGRRKVGKTFLLRELAKFKNYFMVKKDLEIVSDNGNIDIKTLIQNTKNLLLANKTIIIDEFQRLNESILEELMLLHPKGRLILSGSSMKVVKNVLEPKSALLGFFTPIKIGFISPADMLLGIQKKMKGEQAIEVATFLREPWLIPIYNKEKIIDFVYKIINESKQVISALIGEIFTEEERELTKRYETILSLIGRGIWNTKEITSILYARKLIPDPSPNHVIQYLKNLEEMELVESIKLHKTKGNFYRLFSPIMNIYYYLDDRYDISNRQVSLNEIEPTLQKLINLEIQNFIADLFAEVYNGKKEYLLDKNKEIDFIITERNKSKIIGEVKWKKISKEDIEKFKNNSANLFGKKVLICKESKEENQEVEIINSEDVIKLVNRQKAIH